jgi:hypothetical protein
MRPTRLAACYAALTILPVTGAAQPKVDLTGRWTLVRDSAGRTPTPPSTPPRNDLGTGWGETITITQSPDRLIVEYPYFRPFELQPPVKLVFALDGSETRNSVMMGRGIQVETARVTWRGAQPVITTRYTFPDPTTGRPTTGRVTRALSLESPSSLLIETVYDGVLGGPPSTSRAVYRRR